jgi:hydroxymethylbilane synthase
VDVRGNLDTRMRKAEEGVVDAVVLAAAGITRMGWEDRITHRIPVDQMVPAVGQGAVGVEIREDDELMQELCFGMTHQDTRTCVTAERVVMRRLEGGCQVPIGAYARVRGDALIMDGLVASLDGKVLLRESLEGTPDDPVGLGERMVERLLELGAKDVLDAIRRVAGDSGSVDGLLQT